MKHKFTDPPPDFDALFSAQDYLYFTNDQFHNEQRTAEEALFLGNKLCLGPTTHLLDVACGHGRHTIALAPTCASVTGFDSNREFLEIAQAQASARRLSNVTFIHGDIRTLKYANEFNVAVMISTVFGMLSDDETQCLLRNLHRALRRGGKLCFDAVNRDMILSTFKPHFVFEKEGNVMTDRLSFNPLTGRMRNQRTYVRDGKTREADFSLRLFSPTEILTFLEANGFEVQELFSDWAAAPFESSSKKMIVIAGKRE